jgi:hypothetical protein
LPLELQGECPHDWEWAINFDGTVNCEECAVYEPCEKAYKHLNGNDDAGQEKE